MRAILTPDQARQRFAEETDAAADLGPAPDVVERMAAIHAKHEAALNRLRLQETQGIATRRRQKGRSIGM